MRVAEAHAHPPRSTRRWPAAAAAVAVAAALVLTAFLIVQDRSNADAASSSRANTTRDAMAVTSLKEMSKTLEYADVMAGLGVVGLRDIGLHEYLTQVVQPLNGALTLSPSGWTLALGGGWACLTFARHGDVRTTTVTRGICPGAPINSTPAVASGAVTEAIARTESLERAAVLAAFAAAAASPEERHLSAPALAALFAGHDHSLPFRWRENSIGVSVVTDASAACLRPAHHSVHVSLGACP